MTPLDWCNDVAGKPWIDRAYGPNAYDCWGLVIDSFRRIDGIELNQVEGYADGLPTEQIGTKEAQSWDDCEPVSGAVFCVMMAGNVTHVGRLLDVCGKLMACHAVGKNNRGQVIIEPFPALERRYGERLIYKTR